MLSSTEDFKKAATIGAAFLFLIFAAPPLSANIGSFENVRKKAMELLLQKKKNQALQLLQNYSKTNMGLAHREETSQLLLKLARKFMTREAQEAYENSLNLSLEDPKESLKSAEQCLAVEPEQSDCHVQKARLLFMAQNQRAFEATLLELRELIPGTANEQWLLLWLNQEKPEFKSKQILRYLPEKAGDDEFVQVIHEIERAFSAKNYSRAKDVIKYLEKHYPDWPDLLYYQYRIDAESAEERQKSTAEKLQLYTSKCKSLSKSQVRKYRYDFKLCVRKID